MKTATALLPRSRLGSALSILLISGTYAVDLAGAALNSDLIRTRFGSYGVDVLEQDRRQRLASLYSDHEQGRVTRTLALTEFLLPVPEPLATVDREIRAGASLGATLRAAGWQVTKSAAVECLGKAGAYFAELAGPNVTPESPILMRAYRLAATRGDTSVDYATIAEAYHPEHVAPDGQPRCAAEEATGPRTDNRFTTLAGLLEAMHWRGGNPTS